MQVILQKDVKNLGQAGDKIRVKPGYARNWLFPQKWAVPFTKGRGREREHQNQLILSKKKKAVKARQNMVDKLSGMTFSFEREADANGKLFGSVSTHQISQMMETQGFQVDKKRIKLKHSLKEVGEYKVLLDFGSEQQSEVTIFIVKSGKKESKKNSSSSRKDGHKKEEKSDSPEVLGNKTVQLAKMDEKEKNPKVSK